MKNFTTCICIMGLSGFATAEVVMDQIGDMDGSGLGANIMASQDFEAAYDIYDIIVADDFTGDGASINMVEMVLGGWNGFVDPSSVAGYTANLYSSADAAGANLTGDIASQYVDAADATMSPDWMGANFLIGMDSDLSSAVGTQLVGVMAANDFATGGQTGTADSILADAAGCIQANPAGGFGFGPWQAAPGAAAYRISGGAPADPCTLPLPETCAADVDGDGSVAVSDVLAIIGQWGDCGDGTYRPSGDVAPLPNGDCCVTVADVLAVVGSWGADCTVYGACCYGDGTCDSMSNADDCAAAGGSYGGDASTCADISCVAAACCIDSATCVELTDDACTAMGGDYEGDGTACATTDCAAVEAGDECSSAITVVAGANAFDTSDMTPSGDEPTDELCAGTFLEWGGSQDGWYMYVSDGGMTTFDTCDATSYDTSMALYEGSCTNLVACNGDSANQTGCQTYYSEISNYNCVAGETYYVRIGAWQGAEAGPGTLNINPPSTGYGACCFPDESCIDVDAADCDAFGGLFQGDGTQCSDGPCAAGPGDECAGAIDAYLGDNPFDTTMMTPSQPQPDMTDECPVLAWDESPDMWMAWVATGDGNATFSACDATSYDTSMVLYEGTCDNQVACSGDTTGEDGCQPYYSAIYDFPVSAGVTYIVRMGGWQGEVGAGTVNISLVGGDAIGACCLADGSCMDSTSSDCATAGGLWDSASVCADGTCPQVWAGCDGTEYDCDDCWNDGDDSATDCNGGLNVPTPVYQAITLGSTICGTASVFVDGPTGGTYRDLDWYTNASLNAGGDFTMTVGSSGADILFGVVDLNAGAFVNAYVLAGGTVESVTEAGLPAGNYAILCGPADWNTAWSCGSGLENYSIQLD